MGGKRGGSPDGGGGGPGPGEDISPWLQPGYFHDDLKIGAPCPGTMVGGFLAPAIRYSGLAENAEGFTGSTRREVDGFTEIRWTTFCMSSAPGFPVYDQEYFWIRQPNASELVASVWAEARGRLVPAEPEWQFVDEFDWLYVQTPMTLRVLNLSPVSVSASVGNALGSATASVTATPTQVLFETDAPDTDSVVCSIDQLRRPYRPGEGCTITYRHSSAISPDDHFGYSLTTTWEIEADPPAPGIPAAVTTTSTDRIQVAEIQAVVTCQGSGCG